MDAILSILAHLILIALVISLILYMIISIVDEDEKYETYLLQIKGKTYLLVKEREHVD